MQQATSAAAGKSTAEDPSLPVAIGSKPAVVSREEASSSASFDSWHSRTHGDSATTAATAWPPAATATAAGPSRQSPEGLTPAAAAAADAQGIALDTVVRMPFGQHYCSGQ